MRDFNYTVNVLVQAFLNDELEHKRCTACAVGNIVADALKVKPRRYENCLTTIESNLLFTDGSYAVWPKLFCTAGRQQRTYGGTELNDFSNQDALDQIAKTGYSVDELAKIEFAFETAPTSPGKEVRMFEGLMAVVDVLAEIHEVDLTTKETAKSLFVKV